MRAIQCVLARTLAIALVTMVTCPSVFADDRTDAQGIVDRAQATLEGMVNDKYYDYLRQGLKHAKGVLIFPQVLKAGFIVGGSGGTGVLLVRDEVTGEWGQPAFYTMGAVSFGLQIGGEAAEIVMLVNSQRGVDSLHSNSLKLGGDTSVAAGPVGGGAKGAVSASLNADFLSFAKSKGAYAGLNLEGSVLDVRDTLNEGYYGRKVSPVDILVKKSVSNEGAARLRTALAKAASRQPSS
jgi:lipid-binding SYLF domain-containing protein